MSVGQNERHQCCWTFITFVVSDFCSGASQARLITETKELGQEASCTEDPLAVVVPVSQEVSESATAETTSSSKRSPQSGAAWPELQRLQREARDVRRAHRRGCRGDAGGDVHVC